MKKVIMTIILAAVAVNAQTINTTIKNYEILPKLENNYVIHYQTKPFLPKLTCTVTNGKTGAISCVL